VTPFSPGETVVLQEVWREQVWAARPMRVVQDDGDFVALWFPRGTRWRAPTSRPARPWNGNRGQRLAECAARGDWVFRDAEWDVDTLSLMRADDWHALWVSWLPSAEHLGWYVNLQEPFRRSRLGFETMDLMLDLIVDTDRTWRWKDEDELAAFVEGDVFDLELCDRIRAEGLRVAACAEHNEPPFCEPWPRWRADPGWEKPELPRGWEQLWR
jgi:hypothetical protein